MNVALHPDSLNIVSLCTGGGGLDLGVELAMPGARSVVLVEREAFACAHLVAAMQRGLMAPAALWSDVTTFNGRPWRGLVDGLIGGIPCQPHSLAGKRLGEDDERDLWSDARRIIVQSGAWFVLIENVRGIVSSGGAERVCRDLRRLGFALEAGLFTAAEVGATHERERWFCLAVADSIFDVSQWRRSGQVSAPCDAFEGPARLGQRGWHDLVDGGAELADADRERLERFGADVDAQGRPDARGSAGLRGRANMGDAVRARPYAAPQRNIHREKEGPRPRDENPAGSGQSMANTNIAELRREPPAGQFAQLQRDDASCLFPPSPAERNTWRAVIDHAPDSLPALSRYDGFMLAIRAARLAAHSDPRARERLDPQGPYGLRAAVVQALAQRYLRRVADGLGDRVDETRIDELRMLGNGVVPLQAAHAFRTLCHRLAARGSAGAARLVRVMEAT